MPSPISRRLSTTRLSLSPTRKGAFCAGRRPDLRASKARAKARLTRRKCGRKRGQKSARVRSQKCRCAAQRAGIGARFFGARFARAGLSRRAHHRCHADAAQRLPPAQAATRLIVAEIFDGALFGAFLQAFATRRQGFVAQKRHQAHRRQVQTQNAARSARRVAGRARRDFVALRFRFALARKAKTAPHLRRVGAAVSQLLPARGAQSRGDRRGVDPVARIAAG